MPEFLTTREVAALLRIKDCKVYELVAEQAMYTHAPTCSPAVQPGGFTESRRSGPTPFQISHYKVSK
jgi:hypothetical protein